MTSQAPPSLPNIPPPPCVIKVWITVIGLLRNSHRLKAQPRSYHSVASALVFTYLYHFICLSSYPIIGIQVGICIHTFILTLYIHAYILTYIDTYVYLCVCTCAWDRGKERRDMLNISTRGKGPCGPGDWWQVLSPLEIKLYGVPPSRLTYILHV